MPAKMSEEITDLGRSCRFLLTALSEQGDQVAGRLGTNVQPFQQEGDPEPGFSASNVALGRRLGAAMDRLVIADEKVYGLSAELSALRTDRDALTPRLATEIVRLGRTVRGQYEEPDAEGLGLTSPRSRSRETLMRQTNLIDGVFSSEKLEELLGKPAYTGTKVDPKEAAARPVAVAEQLKSITLKIDEKQRHLDAAIIEKDELMQEHGEIFVYTARSFEAQCRLAGLKRLAEKVRPSVRRPGRRAVEVGEDDGELPGGDLSLAGESPPNEPPVAEPPTDEPSPQEDASDPSP